MSYTVPRSSPLKRDRPSSSNNNNNSSTSSFSAAMSSLLDHVVAHKKPVVRTKSADSSTSFFPSAITMSMSSTPRPVIVSLLNNKGVSYLEQEEYTLAKKSLSKALKMAEKTTNTATYSPARNSNPGDNASSEKEIAALSLLFGSSVESSDSSKTPFRHRSEYDEGMDHYNQPLKLDENSLNVDGTILFNLARLQHKQEELDGALCLYKRALETAQHPRHHCARDDALTLAILFGIANIQYVRGDHTDSLTTYTTSLTLAKWSFGEHSLPVAACHNCIGVLNYIMADGDPDMALESMKKALHIRQTLIGEEHIDCGTTWNNIGRIYFQKGDYHNAMQAYENALSIRRKTQGESADVAATIFNIGQVFHQQNEREEALMHYKEFLNLATGHFGEYHRDCCIVWTCIGQVLHETKQYERAVEAFHEALRIGRVALGELHAEIAITLVRVCMHYLYL